MYKYKFNMHIHINSFYITYLIYASYVCITFLIEIVFIIAIFQGSSDYFMHI